MFEISFGEVLTVAVVALLVLGPEELPRTARRAAKLLRILRNYVAEAQREVRGVMEHPDVRDVHQQLIAGRRYILDEAGQYREIFDVADLMPEQSSPPSPLAERKENDTV
jgi:sec-independent protein translocase protein TatB